MPRKRHLAKVRQPARAGSLQSAKHSRMILLLDKNFQKKYILAP